MPTALRAALAAALLIGAATGARAQSTQTVTLVPADRDRWEVALHTGRHGVDRSDIGPRWNGWYEAGLIGLSGGYYLTPHLKLDGAVARSSEATLYVPYDYMVPGQPWPYTRSREHRFWTTSLTGAVEYQFLRNQWFHPFAGLGVAAMYQRERADAEIARPEIRGPSGLVTPALPALPALDASGFTFRPLVATGFKVYVSRHAFLRTDLRVGVRGGGPDTATWRAGAGIDF